MLELQEQKIAKISFSMNRFYQGDWIDSVASRFVDELPDEYIKRIIVLLKMKKVILILIKTLNLSPKLEVQDGYDIKKN